MTCFRHILAPLDFTPKNAEALRVVKAMASPGRTRVTLLHVVEAIAHTEDDPLVSFYQSLEDSAVNKLQGYAQQLADEGIEAEVSVLLGRPARKIVSEAKAMDVDLLVLSSHPLGESASAENGSWATVSYQVSVFCHCPVLLVK